MRFRRVIATLTMTLMMGCYTVRPVNLAGNMNDSNRPEVIELTTRTQAELRIYGPVIRADSLVGWRDKNRTVPASFPLSDIVTARSRELSSGRTAVLVVGVGLVAAAAVYVVLLAVLWDNTIGTLQATAQR